MIDAITGKPITVEPREEDGAFLHVPESQLDRVIDILEGNKFFNWVRNERIVTESGQTVACIVIGSGADLLLLQRLLDVFP